MKLKHILSFCLVLILAFSLSVSCFAFEFPLPFVDVKKDQWYYPYVKEAYNQKITTGTTLFTFEPNGTVTREMFVTMLIRSAGIDMQYYNDLDDESMQFFQMLLADGDQTADPAFELRGGRWYSPYVAYAIALGMTNGVGNGRFGLGQPITREQMATMAARFIDLRPHVQLKQVKTPAVAFSDANQISPWAREAAEAMRLAGVMQGDEARRLNPRSTATRAEAVAVILRLRDASERASFIPAGTRSFLLRDATNLVNGMPAEYPITESADVAKLVGMLDNMPIKKEIAIPPHGGWAYLIHFNDANGEFLTGYQFSEDWIMVNGSMLCTTDDYFKPLIQMMQTK